jgi:hypothetical protein
LVFGYVFEKKFQHRGARIHRSGLGRKAIEKWGLSLSAGGCGDGGNTYACTVVHI